MGHCPAGQGVSAEQTDSEGRGFAVPDVSQSIDNSATRIGSFRARPPSQGEGGRLLAAVMNDTVSCDGLVKGGLDEMPSIGHRDTIPTLHSRTLMPRPTTCWSREGTMLHPLQLVSNKHLLSCYPVISRPFMPKITARSRPEAIRLGMTFGFSR